MRHAPVCLCLCSGLSTPRICCYDCCINLSQHTHTEHSAVCQSASQEYTSAGQLEMWHHILAKLFKSASVSGCVWLHILQQHDEYMMLKFFVTYFQVVYSSHFCCALLLNSWAFFFLFMITWPFGSLADPFLTADCHNGVCMRVFCQMQQKGITITLLLR